MLEKSAKFQLKKNKFHEAFNKSSIKRILDVNKSSLINGFPIIEMFYKMEKAKGQNGKSEILIRDK